MFGFSRTLSVVEPGPIGRRPSPIDPLTANVDPLNPDRPIALAAPSSSAYLHPSNSDCLSIFPTPVSPACLDRLNADRPITLPAPVSIPNIDPLNSNRLIVLPPPVSSPTITHIRPLTRTLLSDTTCSFCCLVSSFSPFPLFPCSFLSCLLNARLRRSSGLCLARPYGVRILELAVGWSRRHSARGDDDDSFAPADA